VRELEVEADCPSETHVEARIRDSGGAFEGEDANRAFEPFFTTRNSGRGMGLPISRSIAEAHGGELWAQGDGDAGTTLSFRLPVPRPPGDDRGVRPSPR